MIAVNWSEAWEVVENLLIVIGPIAAVILLAIILTRQTVIDFLERRCALLVIAGLVLGSIDAFALALHVTSGYPSVYNVLLWISAGGLIAALWLGISIHLPRRVKEAKELAELN